MVKIATKDTKLYWSIAVEFVYTFQVAKSYLEVPKLAKGKIEGQETRGTICHSEERFFAPKNPIYTWNLDSSLATALAQNDRFIFPG